MCVCACACVCRTGLAGRELGEWGRWDEVGWSSGTGSGRAGRWGGYLWCDKMALGTCKLCLSNAREQAGRQPPVLLPGACWQPDDRGRCGAALRPLPWPHCVYCIRHSQNNTGIHRAEDYLREVRSLTQKRGIAPSVPKGVFDGWRHYRQFLNQWEETVNGQQRWCKFPLQICNGKEPSYSQLPVFRYHFLIWVSTCSCRDNPFKPQSLPLSDRRDL